MKIKFDAELTGDQGATIPVYCEVQLPYVGGRKALIHVAVPAQHVTEEIPANPCVIFRKSGSPKIQMHGVHWRSFPTSSNCALGAEVVELLHVDTLTFERPYGSATSEIRLHLAPISYLRDESSCIRFVNKSQQEELFVLDLPGLGPTSFVVEWTTLHHHDSVNFGATVSAGFSAVVALPTNDSLDIDTIVRNFKDSLHVLSVAFRQAVSLHGWTYTREGKTVSTWIAPLDPNVTPSARENRGGYVAGPNSFLECATNLARSYRDADEKIRSLVRHIALSVNPHNHLRDNEHFLVMFSAFERVMEYAWTRSKNSNSSSGTTPSLINRLQQLKDAIVTAGDENASVIAARVDGLIKIVNNPSIQDKLNAFFRVHPAMDHYCHDLWPIAGKNTDRGLREIRHALAHGTGSMLSVNVVAVAKWHLEILLERLIFVLLKMSVPDGIAPNSYLLVAGAKGWYDRDWWEPLRSEAGRRI